jgi:hypothetical protein
MTTKTVDVTVVVGRATKVLAAVDALAQGDGVRFTGATKDVRVERVGMARTGTGTARAPRYEVVVDGLATGATLTQYDTLAMVGRLLAGK